MQIRQLQVARDSVQDRLILRIATQSGEEIRVFITRRFLRELWPALAGMLAGHLAATPGTPASQESGASFAEPFREDNVSYPLGVLPLLASEATLDPADAGSCRLTLREGRERSVNLNLNAELLQALCSMLRAASEQAAWDLALDYGKPAASPAATPAGKTLLH